MIHKFPPHALIPFNKTFSAASLPPDSARSEKLQVLIVDDNEACAKTMGWTVEMMGHEPHIANDALSALALAEQIQPDVIMLDISLPIMNGYKLCYAIRRHETLRHCTLIAQTGWSGSEYQALSMEAGFNYHMVKPVNLEELERVLSLCKLRFMADAA